MFENTNNKTDIETDIGKNSSTEPRKTQAKNSRKSPTRIPISSADISTITTTLR